MRPDRARTAATVAAAGEAAMAAVAAAAGDAVVTAAAVVVETASLAGKDPSKLTDHNSAFGTSSKCSRGATFLRPRLLISHRARALAKTQPALYNFSVGIPLNKPALRLLGKILKGVCYACLKRSQIRRARRVITL